MVSAPNANNGLGNSFYYKEGGNTSKQDILELISSEWVTLGQEGIVIACLQSFLFLNSNFPSSVKFGHLHSSNLDFYTGSICTIYSA